MVSRSRFISGSFLHSFSPEPNGSTHKQKKDTQMMETNNDKLYGYWIDLSNPLFAETAEARKLRATLLFFFRMKPSSDDIPKSRESYVKEIMENYDCNREELFFALRLAMREQLTCGNLTLKDNGCESDCKRKMAKGLRKMRREQG